MATQRDLTFRQMVDLSFGFLGVQIAYALQSANISRIFATLGADPHQLSFFWILPPLMGMIVQPLIGKWSDRTWTRMGRRKPYLIVGAVIAVLVMLFLPNAAFLHPGAPGPEHGHVVRPVLPDLPGYLHQRGDAAFQDDGR